MRKVKTFPSYGKGSCSEKRSWKCPLKKEISQVIQKGCFGEDVPEFLKRLLQEVIPKFLRFLEWKLSQVTKMAPLVKMFLKRFLQWKHSQVPEKVPSVLINWLPKEIPAGTFSSYQDGSSMLQIFCKGTRDEHFAKFLKRFLQWKYHRAFEKFLAVKMFLKRLLQEDFPEFLKRFLLWKHSRFPEKVPAVKTISVALIVLQTQKLTLTTQEFCALNSDLMSVWFWWEVVEKIEHFPNSFPTGYNGIFPTVERFKWAILYISWGYFMVSKRLHPASTCNPV